MCDCLNFISCVFSLGFLFVPELFTISIVKVFECLPLCFLFVSYCLSSYCSILAVPFLFYCWVSCSLIFMQQFSFVFDLIYDALSSGIFPKGIVFVDMWRSIVFWIVAVSVLITSLTFYFLSRLKFSVVFLVMYSSISWKLAFVHAFLVMCVAVFASLVFPRVVSITSRT